MKKNLIILTILFLSFQILSAKSISNFTPTAIDGKICFPLDQGAEILKIVKLYPLTFELCSTYSNKVHNLNIALSNYQSIEKISKKQKIKQGILIGIVSATVGILIGGVGVTVIYSNLR